MGGPRLPVGRQMAGAETVEGRQALRGRQAQGASDEVDKWQGVKLAWKREGVKLQLLEGHFKSPPPAALGKAVSLEQAVGGVGSRGHGAGGKLLDLHHLPHHQLSHCVAPLPPPLPALLQMGGR